MSLILAKLILFPTAAVGVAALVLAAALAAPLRTPAAAALDSWRARRRSIRKACRRSVGSRRAMARGSPIGSIPRQNGATDRLAIVAHGSSALSVEMNVAARTLAESGVAAVAIDARGHGASGSRGDIGYIGQLDDDLADLIAELRKTYPSAKLALIGHSSGGGFALRIAGGPLGREFDRFVLLAPFLGYFAPTNQPSEGPGRWGGGGGGGARARHPAHRRYQGTEPRRFQRIGIAARHCLRQRAGIERVSDLAIFLPPARQLWSPR